MMNQPIQANAYGHVSAYPDAPKGERQASKFNDVIWGLLFFIHLGVMTYSAISFIPQLENDFRNGQDADNGYYYQNNDDVNRKLSSGDSGALNVRIMRALGMVYLKTMNLWNTTQYDGRTLEESSYDFSYNFDPNTILLLVTCITITGIIFSMLSLTLMINFAEPLIKFSVLMNIFLGGGLALFGMVKEMPELIVIGLVIFLFSACYAYFVWNRIPFAATNLVTATTAVKANIGVTFFAWGAIFVGGLWMVFWSATSYATVYVLGNCNMEGYCENDISGIVAFLLLLSFYWTQQVISNIVHVTVAGTVGTWWWAPLEANSCCSEAVRSSYIRAITNSFGSICFGSLLVAIVKAIKSMLEQARETDDGILRCIADCLMGCLETILEIFNEWAFVYVGLYGYTFMEAANNVMTLFKVRGWTAIITDYIVDRVLGLVSFGIGILVGGVAALLSYALGLDFEEPAFFLGLVIGMLLTAVLLGVVGSAVNTIIVCYAEDPASFDTNHFELSARMRSSWRDAFPHDFKY